MYVIHRRTFKGFRKSTFIQKSHILRDKMDYEMFKDAVEEMNRRYVYMRALPNYTTGKNFDTMVFLPTLLLLMSGQPFLAP